MPPYRQTVLAVCAMAFVGSVASMFAQYVLGQNPCVRCILQRLAMMAVFLFALPAAALPLQRLGGRTLAAIVVSAPAALGAALALEHIHLQSLPPALQPPCGAPWTFRLRKWPLFDWYEPIIRGTGECGEIDYILGVPLPWWSLLFFSTTLMVLWGMWWWLRRRAA